MEGSQGGNLEAGSETGTTEEGCLKMGSKNLDPI